MAYIPFASRIPSRRVTGVDLPDATAKAMDAAVWGSLNQVGGFAGTAILGLAIQFARH
jgi:hypothetical protein